MIQDAVWGVSMLLMGIIAAVFVWVAAGADVALANYAPVIAVAYRRRAWLFAAALLILIVANYRSLGELPYAAWTRPLPGGVLRHADAVGEQWSWTVTPSTFVVGQTAEFHVTSKDVNHGFALYDPGMRIVAQTQSMPGYTNILRYTFTEPGIYRVLCLEYCGVEHHDMKTEINVAAH